MSSDAAGQLARRRAMCVWLGALASYRQGLIGRLLKTYHEPAALLEAAPSTLRTDLVRPQRGRHDAADGDAGGAEAAAFRALLESTPAACAAAARRRDGALVTWCDDPYPAALRHLADPPLCLFVAARCDSQVLTARLEQLGQQPVVAVVGTRSPSPYGAEMAALLGHDLSVRGALVISGLAMGVDAIAQEAALCAGDPNSTAPAATIGVLGCGADVVYPMVNRRLFGAVRSGGLLVSEFVWGVRARAWRFPARNRVLAALAHAVVVVEGSSRSGARLTADYALDLGREVLAVPGEAGRKLSQAPHEFLRQGAAICESADDVLTAIAAVAPPPLSVGGPRTAGRSSSVRVHDGVSDAAAAILDALDRGAATADHLTSACALAASVVNVTLAQLELDGLIQRHPGGMYRRRRAM